MGADTHKFAQSEKVTALTIEYLRSILDYDAASGVFRWKVRLANRVKKGDRAGQVSKAGQRRIAINGKRFLSSRLAWFYVKGEWPKNQIDHRDGDNTNDRLSNLREASQSQNMANQRLSSTSTTGFKGVWRHPNGRYRACIKKDKQLIHLGYFDKPTLAHEAYCRAAKELFGEFANAG